MVESMPNDQGGQMSQCLSINLGTRYQFLYDRNLNPKPNTLTRMERKQNHVNFSAITFRRQILGPVSA